MAFEGQTSLAPSSKKKKPSGAASKNSKSKNSDQGSTLASIGGKDPSLDLLKWASFLKAAGEVGKIGLSLKPNHHKQV